MQIRNLPFRIAIGVVALAILGLPAQAQEAPRRFPAVSEERLAELTAGVRCQRFVNARSRTAAETETLRGYAVRICDQETGETLALAVAWSSPRSGSEIFIATPDGRVYPRHEGNVRDDLQNADVSLFTIDGRRGCAVMRRDQSRETFAVGYCYRAQ